MGIRVYAVLRTAPLKRQRERIAALAAQAHKDREFCDPVVFPRGEGPVGIRTVAVLRTVPLKRPRERIAAPVCAPVRNDIRNRSRKNPAPVL